MSKEIDNGVRRNFYGRFKGQTLTKTQVISLHSDLKALSPGLVSFEENPERISLDLKSRFEQNPIWLEIGFGSGEHLLHQAQENPNISLIGCEPYVNGVASLLGKINKSGIQNISIYPGDVRDLFDVLPSESIQKAFLLYPDPWLKRRHNRRRFITSEYLGSLARVMKAGGEFRIATDIEDYFNKAIREVQRFKFDITNNGAVNFGVPWKDWISTRYEKKALSEKRSTFYLTFKKRVTSSSS